MDTICAWVRAVRAARRQSQAEAAGEVGVSVSLWRLWEGEITPPRNLVHLRALAVWGGVDVHTLVDLVPALVKRARPSKAAR